VTFAILFFVVGSVAGSREMQAVGQAFTQRLQAVQVSLSKVRVPRKRSGGFHFWSGNCTVIAGEKNHLPVTIIP